MAESEKNNYSKINENIENNNNAKQRWRKWHITLFDNELSKDDFFKILTNKQCHYAIIGEELAPSTNNRHMHAYVEYDNACTFNSLKKLLADYNPNIQKANGTASQNKVYITKEDINAIEYGTPTSIKYCGDDIASNIIIYLSENPFIELTQIAVDVPEFSDYIVKNYHNLIMIQNRLKSLPNVANSKPQDNIQ